MKKINRLFCIIIISLFLFHKNVSAQETGESSNVSYTNLVSGFTNPNGVAGVVGGTVGVIEPVSRKVDGSYYIFDNWNNDAVIELKTGKSLSLKGNININTKSGAIESKISEDKIYSFELENIKSVTINNNKYLIEHSLDLNRKTLFEVIGNSNDKILIRTYKSSYKEGDPNPLKGQLNDKIITSKVYYIKDKSSLKKIKLNKSILNEEFGNGDSSLKKYMKSQKLTFKNDKDFKLLFNHINSI